MYGLSFKQGAADDQPPSGAIGYVRQVLSVRQPVLMLALDTITGCKVVACAIGSPNVGNICLTKSCRQLDQRDEHRRQIKRRAADHLEHIGGGGLLLERFGQITRPLLHLLKQPRVLDGDYRLIGECLEQFDLAIRKRANLGAGPADRAYRRQPILSRRECAHLSRDQSTHRRGSYRLAKAPHSLQIPVTTQAILAARIDRLSPEDKGILQAASVIGKDARWPPISWAPARCRSATACRPLSATS